MRDGEVHQFVIRDVEVFDRAEIGGEETDGVPLEEERPEFGHRGEGGDYELQLVTGDVERVQFA